MPENNTTQLQWLGHASGRRTSVFVNFVYTKTLPRKVTGSGFCAPQKQRRDVATFCRFEAGRCRRVSWDEDSFCPSRRRLSALGRKRTFVQSFFASPGREGCRSVDDVRDTVEAHARRAVHFHHGGLTAGADRLRRRWRWAGGDEADQLGLADFLLCVICHREIGALVADGVNENPVAGR